MWESRRGRDQPSVLTLIPAHNEEGCIEQVIRELSLYSALTDLLVIDDGSSDDTSRKVLDCGIDLLRLPCNLGVGAALQVGLRFAQEMGYDYVLRLDGDGQHDPDDAFRLLCAVMSGEADAAIGSRFLANGWLARHRSYRPSPTRVLGIKIFALAVSLVTGQPITDPTSGIRCYNRKVVRYLARYHPQDYPEIESTLMLHRAGFRGVELPATVRPRVAGTTSIDSWKSAYYAFRVLLAIFVAALSSPLKLPEEETHDP